MALLYCASIGILPTSVRINELGAVTITVSNATVADNFTASCVSAGAPVQITNCSVSTDRRNVSCSVVVHRDSMTIVDAVSAAVSLSVACLSGSRACGATPNGTITLTPNAGLQTATVAIRTTGSVTAAVTGASLSVGASAAGDAQSLAVLSSTECAPNTTAKQTSSMRYLVSPFVDLGNVAVLLGNLGISALIGLVQLIVVTVLVRRGGGRFAEMSARCFFPNVTFVAFAFLYQGVAVAASRLVVSGTAGGTVLGVVGLLVVLCVPVVGTVLVPPKIGSISTYKRFLKQEGASWYVRYLCPRGFWATLSTRRRFGSLGSRWNHRSGRVVFGPMLVQFLICVIPGLMGRHLCTVQYALVASVLFAAACGIIGLRGVYRSTPANVLGCASYAVLGLLAALIGAQDTADPVLMSSLLSAATTLQMVITVLRVCHDVFVFVLQRFFWNADMADPETADIAAPLMCAAHSPRTSVPNHSRAAAPIIPNHLRDAPPTAPNELGDYLGAHRDSLEELLELINDEHDKNCKTDSDCDLPIPVTSDEGTSRSLLLDVSTNRKEHVDFLRAVPVESSSSARTTMRPRSRTEALTSLLEFFV